MSAKMAGIGKIKACSGEVHPGNAGQPIIASKRAILEKELVAHLPDRKGDHDKENSLDPRHNSANHERDYACSQRCQGH